MKIGLIPPEGAYLTGLVDCGEFEATQSAALHRIGARDSDFDFDSGVHVVLEVSDARKIRTVLVAHRQVVEQVGGGDAAKIGCAKGSRKALRKLLSRLNWNARKLVEVKLEEWR